MSKEKREYQATIQTGDLRLELTPRQPEKAAKSVQPEPMKKQFFSPELIARVTERIKKL